MKAADELKTLSATTFRGTPTPVPLAHISTKAEVLRTVKKMGPVKGQPDPGRVRSAIMLVATPRSPARKGMRVVNSKSAPMTTPETQRRKSTPTASDKATPSGQSNKSMKKAAEPTRILSATKITT